MDPTKDRRIGRDILCGDAEPGRRLDLGHAPRQSRRGRARRSGQEPAQGAVGDLQRADAGLRRARRRHRQAGPRVWSRWPAATWASSTAASARARSTARRRPATTAPKAGRSTSIPGPGFKGIGENSVESSYYSWVDQHNTFGLGEDIPMSTANLMDGLVALDKDGKMVSIQRALSARLLRQGLRRPHRRSRTPAGRAAACGPPTATARRG